MTERPAAFMSYVRSDDQHENGRLTELCKRLSGELRLQTGEEFWTSVELSAALRPGFTAGPALQLLEDFGMLNPVAFGEVFLGFFDGTL